MKYMNLQTTGGSLPNKLLGIPPRPYKEIEHEIRAGIEAKLLTEYTHKMELMR